MGARHDFKISLHEDLFGFRFLCLTGYVGSLQKWVCTTVGPTFSISFESSTLCQNVASLSLFYGCFLGRYSFELAESVHLLFGSLLAMSFLSPLLDLTRISMLSLLQHNNLRLHLLDIYGFFLISFLLCFSSLPFYFFCESVPCTVLSALY